MVHISLSQQEQNHTHFVGGEKTQKIVPNQCITHLIRITDLQYVRLSSPPQNSVTIRSHKRFNGWLTIAVITCSSSSSTKKKKKKSNILRYHCLHAPVAASSAVDQQSSGTGTSRPVTGRACTRCAGLHLANETHVHRPRRSPASNRYVGKGDEERGGSR